MHPRVDKYLWSHVNGGPAGLGLQVALKRVLVPAQPHVADLCASGSVQEDVMGLQVAVDNVRVEGSQALSYVPTERQHLQVGQGLLGQVNPLVQGATGHKLVDDADVRRLQAGAHQLHNPVRALGDVVRHDLQLGLEVAEVALQIILVLVDKHLDSNIKAAPLGSEDLAESACPQLLLDGAFNLGGKVHVKVNLDVGVGVLAARDAGAQRLQRGSGSRHTR
mmetsp:Transcript_25111/g.70161  ORF Transcript_25111/g.70161 Transcript_25111/m.70161 type:complete len:221 (+) Transcript_25111:570-1232(+)